MRAWHSYVLSTKVLETLSLRPPWSLDNVLFWEIRKGPNRPYNPYTARLVVVYEERSDPRYWDILGTTFDLPPKKWFWDIPFWNPAWSRLEESKLPRLNGDVNILAISGGIRSVWKGEQPDWSLCGMEQLLCVVADLMGSFGTEFERLRSRLFKEWIADRLRQESEEAIFAWMTARWGKRISENLLQPDVNDLASYLSRHGPNTPEPRLWLRVGAQDSPALQRLGCLDLIPWILLQLDIERTKRMQIHYKLEDPSLEPRLVWLIQECIEARHLRKKATSDIVAISGDIEDICKSAAPCMKRLFKASGFPKDKARNALVRGLKAANYNDESIEGVLVHLMELELAGATLEDIIHKKWDYRSALTKGYAPMTCDELTEICTFGSDNSAGKNCNKCFKLMTESKPEVKPLSKDAKRFGPHKWWLFGK